MARVRHPGKAPVSGEEGIKVTSRDLAVGLVILGAIVLLPVLGMALWGFGMMGPGMMGGWGWGGGFGGFGLLTALLVIAGIVFIVLAFARKEARPDEPLELLKRRLARGEITREQYEEFKQVLQ